MLALWADNADGARADMLVDVVVIFFVPVGNSSEAAYVLIPFLIHTYVITYHTMWLWATDFLAGEVNLYADVGGDV